jgi:hypothetical protein
MDGEDLFQKGMIGMGALGGVLAALVLCVGVTGIDSWALGLDEEAPEAEQPIADANGVVFVPADQQVVAAATKAVVRCRTDAFGADLVSIPTLGLHVTDGQVEIVVPADVADQVEVPRVGGAVIVSWPAVPANGTGECKVERKAEQQAPAGP